ncbi:MAG: Mur ligase family protein [Firmicutes bacterium]|nr:Mur ligase family protein [Bacillota bacterium]
MISFINVQDMFAGFASIELFSLALVVAFLNAFLLCIVAYKPVHVFQLGGYRLRPYISWLANMRIAFYVRLFVLSILSFGSMFIFNVVFDRWSNIAWVSYLGLLFYFFLVVVFCLNIKRKKEKVKLRFTPRIIRLFIALYIVFFGMTYLALWVGSTPIGGFVQFSFIALIPLFVPPFVSTVNYVLWPIEEIIRQYYLCRARKKLFSQEYNNVIRIGITGSYAKTSCKNMLGDILSKKYKVAKSPSSYNTPMGFALTVNKVLEPGHEIVIFEMGLRYKNNIRQLAKLFKPQHGILTAIGSQHIETMKTIDAIMAEKSELVRALPSDGIAVLNGQSEGCIKIYDELSLENKFLTNIKDNKETKSKYYASNISVTSDGCEFDASFDGQVVRMKTALLGRHNVENIMMCATLAFKLGVSIDQIKEAVAELKPTPHRLELIKGPSGVIVLDDSYNASEQGTRAALDVLSLFDGRKVVQTPGIVEQGKQQGKVNFKYGRALASIVDDVIIVNEVNREAIVEGLKSKDFPIEKIHLASDLEGAKTYYSKLLSKGDVLLIANDLPDNFL